MKVENLSSGTITVYEACPYCLTEITIEETTIPVKQRSVAAEEKETETSHKEEKASIVPQQPSVEVPNCRHYFGYLSERSSRDAPPEECMVCPKIVQCMLKGVTG